MVFLHRQRCWLLFLGLFFGFPHFPWVWPFTWIAAYTRTTLLSDHIVAIYPPLEACFWTRPLQWLWCRRWQLILQWHRTYISCSCCWQPTRQNSSWIIIRRWLADSAIRSGSLYDGAALIAPEDGNTLRSLVRSQRWCPVRLGMGGGVQFFVGHQGDLKKRPALLSTRLHFPGASHLNSSRYHLVLLTLTFPSVSGPLLRRDLILIEIALLYILIGSWEREISGWYYNYRIGCSYRRDPWRWLLLGSFLVLSGHKIALYWVQSHSL